MLKRLFDIITSAAVLILSAPFLLLIAAAVWIDSGRPIFYSQWRVGKDFRKFRIRKFRSMRTGGHGASITVSGDRRVTRIGRVLRAAKLDELPQFWNVLRGDMSLVGPRPEVSEYVELFMERYRRVLTLRPGITDLASIQFRNEEQLLADSEEPMREYVRRILPAKLDLAEEYLRKRSFFLDLSVLFRTVLVTFRKS
ncbi:MAG: sugar transferase [Acidobacteria bacterium]|nr:sugar transferase [Acidobacteriota bacterium]